jgi:hypothetical protein
VAGTNPVRGRLASYWLCYDLYDAGWRVAVFVIGWRSVDLNQLRVVNAGSKAVANRIGISSKAIGCDLKLASRGLIDLLCESHGIACRSPSKVPSQDHLRTPPNGNEAVGISAQRVAVRIHLFLAPDESPNLITLSITHAQAVDGSFKKALAAISSDNRNLHNRVLVNTSEPLNRANRATLNGAD